MGVTIERVIDARPRSVESFTVGRVLPVAGRRTVGPFIFFDHMGPSELGPGGAMDVRPHPHIGLATVTYLFDGALVHRDSLGSEQRIRPGDVNWMIAGYGVVHSERTPTELRGAATRLHGLQLWVALPRTHEETAPEFHHYPAAALPALDVDGARVRVLAGTAYGATSPVRTLSSLLYVEASLPRGAQLAVPDAAERAVYVVDGVIRCDGERAPTGRMLVFAHATTPTLHAELSSRIVLIGGAPLDGPRQIWWNFVSSSRERIERAKLDWRDGRFPRVAGDEIEFVPLPRGAAG